MPAPRATNGTFSSVNGSGDGANSYPDDTADWVYHDPEQNNDEGEKQFKVAEDSATVWVKYLGTNLPTSIAEDPTTRLP